MNEWNHLWELGLASSPDAISPGLLDLWSMDQRTTNKHVLYNFVS